MFRWGFRLVATALLSLMYMGVLALAGMTDLWPAAIGAAIVTFVAGSVLARMAFERLMTMPFVAKGAPLRDARVELHGIVRVDAPADDDDDADAAESRVGWTWHEMDVTVTPSGACSGPFRNWDPHELSVVPADAETGPRAPQDRCDDCTVSSVTPAECCEQALSDEDAGPCEQHGADASARVRITFGAAPGVSAVKLRYYFESFGDVTLPARERELASVH